MTCDGTSCCWCTTLTRNIVPPGMPPRSMPAASWRCSIIARHCIGARRTRSLGQARARRQSRRHRLDGDDGSIWGAEASPAACAEGFERVAHLRSAALAGGDAAAQHPVQAAAGFLRTSTPCPSARRAFNFPPATSQAVELVRKNVRSFRTTSMGRLFDAAAALLGFTRAISFEGQAAMWLEHLAQRSSSADAYPFPFADGTLDFVPCSARWRKRAGVEATRPTSPAPSSAA